MGSVIAVPIAVALTLISGRPSDFITFIKWCIAYIYIEIWNRLNKKRFDFYDMEAHNDPIKVGFLPPKEEYALESPQVESHLLDAADEVFVYGVNSSSECLVARIARAANNEADAWIYLKLNDGKVYKLKESAGYQHSCSDTGREFTCGGFRMNYIVPMRQWRVFYNGLLRETSEEDLTLDRMVYVKFAFIWRASSDCFDMTCDINSAALAMGFAKTKWKSWTPPLKEVNDALNCYAQAGTLSGTVSVDGETSERILYLFGERFRFLGNTSLYSGAEFTHILGQVSKNGMIAHIAEATIPNVITKLHFGFVVLPSGGLEAATDPSMLIDVNSEKRKESIQATFHADGLQFQLKGNLTGKQSHFESKKGWDGLLSIDCLNIEIDSLEGRGVIMKGKILKQSKTKNVKLTAKEIPEEIPYVVHFAEELCKISEITGGKGSSLGKLTQLSKELQNFIVPYGIVVTTSAYQMFINDDIRKEVKSLEDVLYGNAPGDVKESCQRVMNEVIKANIPDSGLQAVIKCLHNVYGDMMHAKKFAIRSSATGEDTEQMSAAGQMETFLGIKGLGEIMSAVKKCWASQFSFIAVQYKRQYGQIINSPMAVVIQEMVPCDVAGVLFTCDPLTGNPTLMSITGNYGLGESVVSGSEEPDSIVLSRSAEDNLDIKEKMIGAKSHRIVVKEDEGTSLEEVAENEKNSCCLSDAMILRLGNIGIQIEKSYRSNRDIEWGFWNNNLYIFQSRPVTSGTGESDFEIDHEMDGPMRIEHEYFTVCNVGEVMPGAMSPLGLDILFKYFTIAFQRRTIVEFQSKVHPRYFPKGLVHMYNHVMFYGIDLLEKISEGKSVIEATMVAMFGRVLDDKEIYEIALERYGRNAKQSPIVKNYLLLKGLYIPGKKLKEGLKHYANYHVPVEKFSNSQDIFDGLMHACDELTESMICHMVASQASSIWNMFIITILGKARGGICSAVYSDFAKLLTSINGVESADVPSAMQSLAYHIGKEITAEELKKMDCEEIEQWLTTSPSKAGVKFREFLEKHGHRCLKEFDVRSVTWGTNPKLLIQLLQNLVGNVPEDAVIKKPESLDEMLSSFDVSFGFGARMALKFLLPRSRSGVQYREATKSLLIKIMDDWRKGYRHLAKVMVSEGRIPDEDILYFMLLPEIQELLRNRSPKIISKANHRRRRYPELDSYIFPEIVIGFPHPVNVYNTPVVPIEDNFMMKGVPVSQGVAKGFVRVAMTLEEASHLKPGEILLTYSTDIGWTPYFPMLAGVVTELGGLISHGAVVSREYGLPCIAGLHGATRQFMTGDYVLLDGNKGILQKLQAPE